MGDKVVWIEQGWQPVPIGFVPNEQAWDREMKRLRVAGHKPFPCDRKFGGHTEMLTNHEMQSCVILVAVGRDFEGDGMELIMTLVHEAVHAWQFLCKFIGEKKPGIEMEAYGIENISRGLVNAYTSTQGKGVKWDGADGN